MAKTFRKRYIFRKVKCTKEMLADDCYRECPSVLRNLKRLDKLKKNAYNITML